MFSVLLSIVIVGFSLLSAKAIPVNNEARCTLSKLGCSCLNIETITKETVESCCNNQLGYLLITGLNVKKIAINLTDSPCSKTFENLMIRDTEITEFSFPFYGLDNLVNIHIENNPKLSDLHKLYFGDISTKIKSISVENNIVRSIAWRTFANLTNLTELKLSENKIGYIEEFSFANLTNLNMLYLNSNILTVLTADLFAGLEKLKILNLVNNVFMDIKQDAFKHLKNLQYLQLSSDTSTEYFGIRSLPDRVFFSVKKLKFLNVTLKMKNLTALTFYGLNDLEQLDLQGNQLSAIPSGTLQQVPKVVAINMSRNVIHCLSPDTFNSLPRLKSLDLSYNELSYISNEVFADLVILQHLDLSDNNLYVIEKNAFVGLKSLLIFKMNVMHGKLKSEIQNNFSGSPLAKLRNITKIIGFGEYSGIYNGLSEGAEYLPSTGTAGKQNLTELEKSKKSCPYADQSEREWVDSTQGGSRKYLLIIVGICVVFLLIAFAIIMSYRAWSKRKMDDLSYNVDSHEKQEMLINKCAMINGRIDNNPNSKSHQTRTSLNGCYIAEISPDGLEKRDECYFSSPTDHTKEDVAIVPISCPIPKETQSDDESALTPLGVL